MNRKNLYIACILSSALLSAGFAYADEHEHDRGYYPRSVVNSLRDCSIRQPALLKYQKTLLISVTIKIFLSA
jgi:hypothetical protein